MSQLTKLQNLNLKNNNDLGKLPLTLGEIPDLMDIQIDKTNISNESCQAILARCQAKRDLKNDYI
jgi:hypothetical protein